MIFVVLRMTLTPPYRSLCGSRRSGGIRRRQGQGNLPPSYRDGYHLLRTSAQGLYEYMPLCRRSADPIPVYSCASQSSLLGQREH